MTLGDIIRNHRKEHGLSMEDFAKLCNMSKGYISMLEKNKNPRSGKPIIPSVATYANVASAMNIKTENLMSMVDKDQPVNIAPTTPAGSPAMDSSAPGGTQGSAEGADEQPPQQKEYVELHRIIDNLSHEDVKELLNSARYKQNLADKKREYVDDPDDF